MLTAALLYGSIISATDPVAVVVLLKELGASRRLATLIEGESLLNDGTAMVVFLVILDIVKGKELTVGDIHARRSRLPRVRLAADSELVIPGLGTE